MSTEAQARPEVRVTHRFEASAERVFDAWLSAELIEQWMFGNVPGEQVLRIALEARPKGKFSFLVRRGSDELDHVGEYFLIERPSALAFSWGIRGNPGSRVDVTLAPVQGGTELTLLHTLAAGAEAYIERTAKGWTTMLSKLATVLKQTG